MQQLSEVQVAQLHMAKTPLMALARGLEGPFPELAASDFTGSGIKMASFLLHVCIASRTMDMMEKGMQNNRSDHSSDQKMVSPITDNRNELTNHQLRLHTPRHQWSLQQL